MLISFRYLLKQNFHGFYRLQCKIELSNNLSTIFDFNLRVTEKATAKCVFFHRLYRTDP